MGVYIKGCVDPHHSMGSVPNGGMGVYIKGCVDPHHSMGSVPNGGIYQGLS